MFKAQMDSFNVQGGLFNREIPGIVSSFYSQTVDNDIDWAQTEVTTPTKDDVSFTAQFGEFTVEIGRRNNHPALLLTNDVEGKIAVRVDAEYPPDLSVRAKLAGDVFGLVMLVEHQVKLKSGS